MVLTKSKGFLKAAQTEITQPLTHKIPRFSRFQSPKVQLTFSARQPPAIASFPRNITKKAADLCGEKVQYTLPIVRDESVQKDEGLYFSGTRFYRAADDHPCVAVPYEHRFVWQGCQRCGNILHVLM
jgi:hypothetical protein